jgi:hypothetical protein
MPKITVTHEFSGMGDYWGGNGRRWDDNAGCLFASYDGNTSVRDLVDGWVNDFCAGGDCDSLPEDVTDSDVRDAILAALSSTGRAAYDTGSLSDESVAYAEANGIEAGVPHDDENDEDDWCEFPVSIILIECEVCSECGVWAEHAVDDICAPCAVKAGSLTCEELEDWDDCADCGACPIKQG